MSDWTIRIKRAGCYDDIPADVDGPFAIHETIPLSLGGWTLTHIPSGYAVLTSVLHGQALACRAELLASGLDWASVAAPADLTPAHRRVGRALREKYQDRQQEGK